MYFSLRFPMASNKTPPTATKIETSETETLIFSVA